MTSVNTGISSNVFPSILVAVLALSFVSRTTSADEISWVDFSSYPDGATQVNGLTSADGLEMNVSFSNFTAFRDGYPRSGLTAIDDPTWPFENQEMPFVSVIGPLFTTHTSRLRFDFVNPGGLDAGGSIGVLDLESVASSVTMRGYREGSVVPVNWNVAFYQTVGVNEPQPIWDPVLNRLTGVSTSWDSGSNNFVFLITDVQLDAVEFDIVSGPGDGIGFGASRTNVSIPEPSTLLLGLTGAIVLIRQRRRCG